MLIIKELEMFQFVNNLLKESSLESIIREDASIFK